MNTPELHFLYYCGHTLTATSESGIQRVVRSLSGPLQNQSSLDFIKWDDQNGQPKYLDLAELRHISRGANSNLQPNPNRAKANVSFWQSVKNVETTWLIWPEVSYHAIDGNLIFAKTLAQARYSGVKTAALLYDLIPMKLPPYTTYRQSHLEYISTILQVDAILTISEYVRNDFLSYLQGVIGDEKTEFVASKTRAVPLGCEPTIRLQGQEAASCTWPRQGENRDTIVLLGTIEPRKQQTRFLRIFNDLLDQFPHLSDINVNLFGSLHPMSSAELEVEFRRNPNIKYFGHVPDSVVLQSFERAYFSAFISLEEGYGLPILESVANGVPCLTSDFGAMIEVTGGMGCECVNTTDDDEIAAGILKLIGTVASDRLDELRREIVRISLRTWQDVTNDLRAALVSLYPPIPATTGDVSSKTEGRGFSGWQYVEIRLASDIPKIAAVDSANCTVGLIYLSRADLMELNATDLDAICRLTVCLFETDESLWCFREILSCHNNMPMPGLVGAMPINLDSKDSIHGARKVLEKRLKFLASQRNNAKVASDFLAGHEIEVREPLLTIAISTFNRPEFVAQNIAWTLDCIRVFGGKVQFLVVDNLSSDLNVETLLAKARQHVGDDRIRVIVNSANVGMLGNLRRIASLCRTPYLWIIGDDDFINPFALSEVLKCIEENPAIPLISMNFGVYYRRSWNPQDSVQSLWEECVPVSRARGRVGIQTAIELAEYSDNMFTAVYPLVMRTDHASACFSGSYYGTLFSSMAESVPTTKYILEVLAHSPAFWVNTIGVLGNAHNSWESHRARWHAVLMPQVILMARLTGLSPYSAQEYLNTHMALLSQASRDPAIADLRFASPLERAGSAWRLNERGILSFAVDAGLDCEQSDGSIFFGLETS